MPLKAKSRVNSMHASEAFEATLVRDAEETGAREARGDGGLCLTQQRLELHLVQLA